MALSSVFHRWANPTCFEVSRTSPEFSSPWMAPLGAFQGSLTSSLQHPCLLQALPASLGPPTLLCCPRPAFAPGHSSSCVCVGGGGGGYHWIYSGDSFEAVVCKTPCGHNGQESERKKERGTNQTGPVPGMCQLRQQVRCSVSGSPAATAAQAPGGASIPNLTTAGAAGEVLGTSLVEASSPQPTLCWWAAPGAGDPGGEAFRREKAPFRLQSSYPEKTVNTVQFSNIKHSET